MHPQRTLIEAAQQVYEQFGTPGGFGHPDTPLVPKDRGLQRTFHTDPEKISPQRMEKGPANFVRHVVKSAKGEFGIGEPGPVRKLLQDLGVLRTEPYKSKRPTPKQASTTEFLTVFKDQLRGKSPDEIEAGGGLHTHGIPETPYDDSAYGERPKHWPKPFGEK